MIKSFVLAQSFNQNRNLDKVYKTVNSYLIMSLKEFILSYGGCPAGNGGCFGPSARWEFLGLPIKQYPSMIITTLVITIIFSVIFFAIRRKDIKFKKIVKVSGIAFIVSLVLVWVFNMWMQAQIVY